MIAFDPKKLKTVKINEVRPNTWNPKDKNTDEFLKVKQGVSLKGQRMPIVVRENNGYEILDGQQRWTACKELGFEDVLIYNEGQVSDKESKELTIWYQQQVPFNEVELAGLIKDLSQYPDLELPYTTEEIKDFIDLESFDWNQYDGDKDQEPKFDEGVRTLQIKMAEGQYKIVAEAIEKVKKATNSPDGRALELICIEFMNSPEGTTGMEAWKV